MHMLVKLIFTASILATLSAKPARQRYVFLRQDTSGNYLSDFDTGLITKTEERTQDGEVKGSYRFKDVDGNLRELIYFAGRDGFQAFGSDLPVGPSSVQETPEVAKARQEHLAKYNEILKNLPITKEFYQGVNADNTTNENSDISDIQTSTEEQIITTTSVPTTIANEITEESGTSTEVPNNNQPNEQQEIVTDVPVETTSTEGNNLESINIISIVPSIEIEIPEYLFNLFIPFFPEDTPEIIDAKFKKQKQLISAIFPSLNKNVKGVILNQ